MTGTSLRLQDIVDAYVPVGSGHRSGTNPHAGSPDARDRPPAQVSLEVGDVLIMPARPGFPRVVPFDGATPRLPLASLAARLRPDTRWIGPRYLFWLLRLHLDPEIRAMQEAAFRTQPSPRGLLRLEIALPTLTEQERVADVLDGTELARGALAAAEARRSRILTALHEEMFGVDSTTRWPTAPLSAIARLRHVRSGPPPLQRSDDVGLIAVVAAGERCGSVDPIDDSRSLHDMIVIEPRSRSLDGRYLLEALRQLDLGHLAHGTTIRHLTRASLDHVEVPLPPPPLQRRFSERARRVDELNREAATAAGRVEDLWRAVCLGALEGASARGGSEPGNAAESRPPTLSNRNPRGPAPRP